MTGNIIKRSQIFYKKNHEGERRPRKIKANEIEIVRIKTEIRIRRSWETQGRRKGENGWRLQVKEEGNYTINERERRTEEEVQRWHSNCC